MVEVLDETQRYPFPDELAQALEALLAHLDLQDREVTVVLCDDAQIRRMNDEDRGFDEPTDVLAYPTHEPDDVNMPEISLLGDIVISLDTASRQAAEHGHSLAREVKVLAAHGLLHLLGYDHPTEESWRNFENAQRLILTLSPDA